MFEVTIVGGGLAGCEAALFLADRGVLVQLWDMKPEQLTPASNDTTLGELVCSNSLRSADLTSAAGWLKEEMRLLKAKMITAAQATAVEAGKALAVDRKAFARNLENQINLHPNIKRYCICVESIDQLPKNQLTILATGPMTHPDLANSLARLTGKHFYFYDAISPTVYQDSVDMNYAFWGNRYAETGDYLNCPLDKAQWDIFYKSLTDAPKAPLREFEKPVYFEGCLPLEVMAERGPQTLLFGPMKPVGFIDPQTNKRPHALLQLRKEDSQGQLLNMVGCQTRLTYPAQKEVFRLIPALHKAEFARWGSIHRNTFIDAPNMLQPDLLLQRAPHIMITGQLAGVEGYIESAALGILAGINAYRLLKNLPTTTPPATTALGGLVTHLTNKKNSFQPSNINWGLLPPIPTNKKIPKSEKNKLLAQRAFADLQNWINEYGILI